MVTTLPISGSMAALARWNSKRQPAKISSGRLCISAPASDRRLAPAAARGWRAMGALGIDLGSAIERSAISAGTSNSTVTMKTARAESRYPHAPIAAAAKPLPTEAKRALRPSRSPIAAWPTRPRLIAAIAGPSTQLASACSTDPASTIGKIGSAA